HGARAVAFAPDLRRVRAGLLGADRRLVPFDVDLSHVDLQGLRPEVPVRVLDAAALAGESRIEREIGVDVETRLGRRLARYDGTDLLFRAEGPRPLFFPRTRGGLGRPRRGRNGDTRRDRHGRGIHALDELLAGRFRRGALGLAEAVGRLLE